MSELNTNEQKLIATNLHICSEHARFLEAIYKVCIIVVVASLCCVHVEEDAMDYSNKTIHSGAVG